MNRTREDRQATGPIGKLGLLLALALLATALLATAADAAGPSWRFAPALPPSPPPGVQGVPYSLPLGTVGDIEFWQPNRGLLITGGGGPVASGVWAYDGVNWHELSSVCGGADGRIAWAGPEDFWTISDQRPGQLNSNETPAPSISLCHFSGGQVIASYATPLDLPDSYLQMDAAACLSPDDCWFGGQLGEFPNVGAFHLHWDGQNVSLIYSPIDHQVSSMAVVREQQGGRLLYESSQAVAGDQYHATEGTNHPWVLDTIGSTNTGVDGSFFHPADVVRFGCAGLLCSLPDYGTDQSNQAVDPQAQAGLQLSSDNSGASPAGSQLWAVAAPATGDSAGEAHPIVLFDNAGAWSQVVPDPLASNPSVFTDPNDTDPSGVAADPGSSAAWITFPSSDNSAHVERIAVTAGANGPTASVTDAETLGAAQGVGARGSAGPIACPAAGDCWMATSAGWLFHLTDGGALPQDSDPNFAGVISFRPLDGGVPQLPLDVAENDDSLANQLPPPLPPAPPKPPVTRIVNKQVLLHLKSHVVHGTTLELTFTLATNAHVQLIAERQHHVVARTARKLLRTGKRRLTLRLNPHAWPTKLDLRATPLHPFTKTVIVTPGGSTNNSVAPASNSNSLGT